MLSLYDLESTALELYQSKLTSRYRLSKNFVLGELASKDGADRVLVHPGLMVALQAIRDAAGRPITITSGYRTAAHNKAVGGSPSSYHVRGMAADITWGGSIHGLWEIVLSTVELGGMKLYADRRFIHIDVGPQRVW
jgi:zinc D-Ala-D-Ala carboxypeptidase